MKENNHHEGGQSSGGKRIFSRRFRGCPLENVPNNQITYYNLNLLQRFVSEGGRILPSRVTAVSAKKQRKLKEAIKRARNLALLPYCAQHN